MAGEHTRKSGDGSLGPDDQVNASGEDGIVSVNERGRRQGGRLGPFLAMGGVALVVLIGGLASFNVLKARLVSAKPQSPAANPSSSAGLARTFQTEAPPLPGAAPAPFLNAPSPCPDGSAGNLLRGRDGIVVRNASGAAVRVCPDGQVAGVTPAETGSAPPIPVERSGERRARSSAPAMTAPAAVSAPDTPMMLNGVTYGESQQAGDASARTVQVRGLRTEGLLTPPAAGSLEGELTPSRTPLVQAARLADLNMLLPKGRSIDCGMSMRIISSLAGQASCVVTQNVYSANGKVLLIERGSEAVGEYRSGVSVGQKRLFVLWTRIITPSGVVINLDSPGADELGSMGLTGKVDNHWFERIGSAFLLSVVQDVIRYKIVEEQARSGGQTIVLGNTARTGSDMAERVLSATINIPPTLYKNQGDRAVIYVARDLDFSNVYALRTTR